LVSTIPSASKAISVTSLFIVVEIKVDDRLQPQTYHRKREESREATVRRRLLTKVIGVLVNKKIKRQAIDLPLTSWVLL